ncbi:hypothetical protein ASF10_06660 [Flavobacterium sp. Leaf82]|nr:hypothetical protein ASF10_06660 [Flavobacterium sp. Leaf82]
MNIPLFIFTLFYGFCFVFFVFGLFFCLFLFQMDFSKFVISTKEKSSQETPQQFVHLCRAANEDFSFVEMTILCVIL